MSLKSVAKDLRYLFDAGPELFEPNNPDAKIRTTLSISENARQDLSTLKRTIGSETTPETDLIKNAFRIASYVADAMIDGSDVRVATRDGWMPVFSAVARLNGTEVRMKPSGEYSRLSLRVKKESLDLLRAKAEQLRFGTASTFADFAIGIYRVFVEASLVYDEPLCKIVHSDGTETDITVFLDEEDTPEAA